MPLTAAEIKEKSDDSELLTREGGPVQVTEGQRRLIALYANGLAIIAPNSRWSSEVKLIQTAAREKGFKFENFQEADIPTILDIYKDSAPDPSSAGNLELERQIDLASVIAQAGAERASDIHIRVLKRYTEVRIRVFGRVKDFGSRKTDEGMALIKAAFAVASDLGSGSSDLTFQQGALTSKSGLLPPKVEMVRLQYSPTSDGRGALVMRLKYEAPANEVEINHLGYNEDQINDITLMRKRTNGMYVLAGKVSSGKSTTLQRVLNKMFMDKDREISMFTIEEPVELDLPGAIQVPVKKNPDGTDGFVEAMKASLRSDPNVIVLGETRSTETAKLAVQAVMTGHALWTTVHAGTALGILDRLTDLGVESWKLADPTVVRGLVYQRLTGVICKNCRITLKDGVEAEHVEVEMAHKLCDLFGKSDTELFVRGSGCEKCKLGLSGRTVVAETVLTDPELLEHYSKGRRIEMRDYWLKPVADGGLGGVPVLHHALSKVGAGLCDINEVEEEVDLFSAYERDFMFLKARMREDVAILDAAEVAKAQKAVDLEKTKAAK